MQERRAKILQELKDKRKSRKEEDTEWQDVDEHEKEVFGQTGYYDVPEQETIITESDQKLLQAMESNEPQGEGQTLADIIMNKLASGDYIDGDKASELEP